jgi:hypothetical protein
VFSHFDRQSAGALLTRVNTRKRVLQLFYIDYSLCCNFNSRFPPTILKSSCHQKASGLSTTFTMELEDLFYYDPSWRVIVCKQCRVVPQTNIARHMRRHHNATRAFKVAAIKLFERSLDHLAPILDTDEICRNVRPLPIAHPMRFLDVFHDGICCLLCQDDRDRYICRGRTAIEDHLKKGHTQPLRQPGRRRRREVGGIKGLAQAGLVGTPISCQTLFTAHDVGTSSSKPAKLTRTWRKTHLDLMQEVMRPISSLCLLKLDSRTS